MKAFLAGLIGAIALAVIAGVVLQQVEPGAGANFSSPNVRLGD